MSVNVYDQTSTREYNRFNWIYVSVFLLSLHSVFITYIGSSYLAQFMTNYQVGFLYVFAEVLNIIILLNCSKFLNKFGNRHMLLFLIATEGLALFGLAVSNTAALIVPLFIVHQAINLIMLFNLDIFLETGMKRETHTGGVRGIFMTMANLAYVVGPVFFGLIAADNEYWKLYGLSCFTLVPLFLIILFAFATFRDTPYPRVKAEHAFRNFFKDRNLAHIFYSSLVLQIFYATMVVYMPIYLHQVIDFTWPQIGTMFSIMLLPFVIFQIPSGALADKRGERQMLIGGLSILGLSTIAAALLQSHSFIWWTAVLFMTRVGAAITEIMIETYFFKHVQGKDAGFISVFRTGVPFAYIITTLSVSLILFISTFNYAFFLLGLLILFGVRYAQAIEDTGAN